MGTGDRKKLNAQTRLRLVAHPHDNVLRWQVRSLSRTDLVHVVDLAAWGGNGACSCEHFEFRLAPLLRDGAARGTAATRCGHIVVARDAFANHMVQLLTSKAAELEKPGANLRQPCPECGGDCETDDGSPCPECGGTGAV